jgi:hypothetical protein
VSAVRDAINRTPTRRLALLSPNLPALVETQGRWAVVVFEEAGIRIRSSSIGLGDL